MGLIDRPGARGYRIAWRLRFWWMDTPAGARARVTVLVVATLLLFWQLIKMAIATVLPPAEPGPALAYWWVVQLIIAVVAAYVAYAMRPKTQSQPERKEESPTVEDGTAVRDYGGTVWIDYDENFLLAHKIVGRDPIVRSTGKK